MPTAQGPCRFGQYAPYLRQVLDATAIEDVEILSPSSQNAYDGLGELAKPFVRTGWRALLCADLLQKLLLINRPYEERRGDAEVGLRGVPRRPLPHARRDSGRARRAITRRCGSRWSAVMTASASWRSDARDLPLIGIVGEIFCRLNTFSNENLVQCLEGYGAEAWVSDLIEWIWYTTSEHFRKLKLERPDLDGRGARRLGAEARPAAR